MYRRTIIAGTALLLTAACAESPTEPATEATTAVIDNLLAAKNAVEICHYDADIDTYLPISVSGNGNAVAAHLAHGDGVPGEAVPGRDGFVFDAGCAAVDEPDDEPTVFAIAYTDIDPADGEGFKPDTDVLIAKLVDASGDGLVGPGDELVRAQYPLDFTASSFGTFTREEPQVVTSVFIQSSTLLALISEVDGVQTSFGFGETELGAARESYFESTPTPTGLLQTVFQDFKEGAAGNDDIIIVTLGTQGFPAQAVNVRQEQEVGVDSPFLDVDLNYPPAN